MMSGEAQRVRPRTSTLVFRRVLARERQVFIDFMGL